MIDSNPVVRLVLRAISACGLTGGQRDAATSRARRFEQPDSPFVLVARAPDGGWGVFQRNFDKPLVSFNELQEACDYANELAKTRIDSIVLIGKRRRTRADPGSSITEGSV